MIDARLSKWMYAAGLNCSAASARQKAKAPALGESAEAWWGCILGDRYADLSPARTASFQVN